MTTPDFPMQYRRFGKTGLQMPVFSCGGMRYQDGWKDKPLDEIDPAIQLNLEATIGTALSLGINHIETARGYGPSERQLGHYLKNIPRESFILQTKVVTNEDSEEFYADAVDSLNRLQMDYVDLFSIHGINNFEKREHVTRKNGCFEAAQRLRREGRIRHIGFSTHGGVDVLLDTVAFTHEETGEGFDYINLHWYYIYQETWPVIQAAHKRDMGVFIISPSDKGGKLYKAPPRLRELCSPLDPMTFNDLFCLSHRQVSTLSVGAARPSDFNEHLHALPLLDNPAPALEPILERLKQRYEEIVEPELREPFHLGLPPLADMPGNINVGRIVQLRNLAVAYDMVEFGQFRYNLLGTAEDWMPGQMSSPENLNPVRDELRSLFSTLPSGHLLMKVIEEAHELLYKGPQKRLSESG